MITIITLNLRRTILSQALIKTVGMLINVFSDLPFRESSGTGRTTLCSVKSASIAITRVIITHTACKTS